MYLTKLWTCCLPSGCSWRQAWRTLLRIRLTLKNCTSGARSPCSSCKHSQACSEDAYSVNQTFAARRWPESDPYKACIALCAAAMLPMLRTMPLAKRRQAAPTEDSVMGNKCTHPYLGVRSTNYVRICCCASALTFGLSSVNQLTLKASCRDVTPRLHTLHTASSA